MEKQIKRMSAKKAREIVGNLSYNVLYQMGVSEDRPEKLDATLEDLLKADQKARKLNDAQPKGCPRTMQTTVASRGIAAMFTAMSFEGGTPEQPNVVGYANGNYVLVVRESSIRKTQQQHKEGGV